MATFNHLVNARGICLRGPTGTVPLWAVVDDETADFDQLEARVEETDRLWERFLSEPLDPEQVIILDEGTYKTHAGVIVTQALHHGSTR